MKKCLIIRFSSFGDIIQLMSVLPALKSDDLCIHWFTKKEFAPIAALSKDVDKVWEFDKNKGLFGLIKFAWFLKSQNYTHIYDAHRNIRSFICVLILKSFQNINIVSRSKERWKRFLLFNLRINKFPRPYRGMNSYHTPLKKWNIKRKFETSVSWQFDNILSTKKKKKLQGLDNRVLLAPFAAWKMKTWPKQHWLELVCRWSKEKFVVLGGKKDKCFPELEKISNVVNLVGKLSFVESCYLISRCKLLICADTGLIHAADILGVKGISLIGPTAFGFPTNDNITVLEVPLHCRPCSKDGRGRCSQKIYQRCMVEISPKMVAATVQSMINNSMDSIDL